MMLPGRIIAAMLALLVMGMIGSSPAWAGQDDHERARTLSQQHQVLPLARIMQIVTERYPGKVLDVELEEEQGMIVYELKVLARDGLLRKVEIDAKSGEIIKARVKH